MSVYAAAVAVPAAMNVALLTVNARLWYAIVLVFGFLWGMLGQALGV